MHQFNVQTPHHLYKKVPLSWFLYMLILCFNSKQRKSGWQNFLNYDNFSGSPWEWASAPVCFTQTWETPAWISQNRNKLKNGVWSRRNQKNHRVKQCAGKCNKQRLYAFFRCPWGNKHPSVWFILSATSSLLLKPQVIHSTVFQLCLCYWTVVQKK